MDEVANNRPELVAYLRRALGYALTGDTSAQAFFVLYGNGANGKSTLLNIVKRIMGPYSQQASIHTLIVQDRHRSTHDLADLKGARFVSVSEAEQTHQFSEALVKQLTGGENIRGCRKYENDIEFTPQCKFFVGTNYLPEIKGTDEGIWRRVHLIPFDFFAVVKDSELPKKLWSEASGILNWLLDGCREWQREGLNPPLVIQSATSKYRKESDVVGLFLDDRCVREKGHTTVKGDLYAAYLSWCEANGHEPLNPKRFSQALKRRDIADDRVSNARFWQDLRMLPTEFDQPSGLLAA